ncbi:nicotinate dehydrogenase subunit A [mine drainage metagenome]|uniref:Nicotinate dehydrogenase subunit A n=1 Tax=mine drainage metagenome TaxID=410659 RepID=A0A1J5SF26_9ZZZZ
MPKTVSFTLNGRPVSLTVDPERTLLWVLRTDLELTGPKFGCGIGQCGACTVLLDNQAVRSCSVPVQILDGRTVVTIEGLARGDELHPVQKAFMEHDALQCGYCTPGMILTACAFLHRNSTPTRNEVIEAMDANLCRCGAHTRIIDAILDAASAMKGAAAS